MMTNFSFSDLQKQKQTVIYPYGNRSQIKIQLQNILTSLINIETVSFLVLEYHYIELEAIIFEYFDNGYFDNISWYDTKIAAFGKLSIHSDRSGQFDLEIGKGKLSIDNFDYISFINDALEFDFPYCEFLVDCATYLINKSTDQNRINEINKLCELPRKHVIVFMPYLCSEPHILKLDDISDLEYLQRLLARLAHIIKNI